jgi:hypothetical protein
MVKSSDVFISLDYVTYMKGKFINRNSITDNRDRTIKFVLKLNNCSSFKKINEVEIKDLSFEKDNFLKKLRIVYGTKKVNSEVYDLVDSCFTSNLISEISHNSIKNVFSFLGINKTILLCSESFPNYVEHKKENRIYGICEELNCHKYVNLPNGSSIYNKEDFTKKNIELSFILNEFNYNTSILDFLFRENKEQLINRLNNYHL